MVLKYPWFTIKNVQEKAVHNKVCALLNALISYSMLKQKLSISSNYSVLYLYT